MITMRRRHRGAGARLTFAHSPSVGHRCVCGTCVGLWPLKPPPQSKNCTTTATTSYRALAGGESSHTETALAFTLQASQPLALYPEGGGASPLRARAHPKYELPGLSMPWDPARGAPELQKLLLYSRLPPAIQRDLERSHQSSTTIWCECSSSDT